MKTIILIIFFFIAKSIFGQINTNVHFSPLVLIEQEKPFRFKRKKTFNAIYNIGVGADIFLNFTKYKVSKNKGFNFGPSIGQYYFWNNNVKTFQYPFAYRENNLVSPICFNLGIGNNPVEKFRSRKGFIYSFDIAFGMAYIQNSVININSNEILTTKKWAEVFKIKVYILTMNFMKNYPHIYLGLQYSYIDGKNFSGANF